MKRIFSLVLISGCSLFLLSSFSIRENPQDPPRGKKTEKHIKMIKVDDNGKKVELDTVFTGDEPFVWNGDTIGIGKELKWISKNDFSLDSLHQNFDVNFEYEIDDDGQGNVFIMKSGKGGEHMMMAPRAPMPPHSPHVMMWHAKQNKNVIDLSDPGIISYDKKIQKDGTEKITIVRKQKPEGQDEEEVIIHSPHGNAMFFGDSPKNVKTIKVIKSDDGTTKVFEDEEIIHMEGKEGTTRFIGDDGKVIIVKEIKEGDEKKIEVIVEEEKEEENK
jgi:hypothetical protein